MLWTSTRRCRTRWRASAARWFQSFTLHLPDGRSGRGTTAGAAQSRRHFRERSCGTASPSAGMTQIRFQGRCCSRGCALSPRLPGAPLTREGSAYGTCEAMSIEPQPRPLEWVRRICLNDEVVGVGWSRGLIMVAAVAKARFVALGLSAASSCGRQRASDGRPERIEGHQESDT